MFTESLVQDIRYALRGMRRSPLFAASVAGTIGIGLGILCSAFTIVNAYLLKAVNLPQPRELYGLSWDTATVQRQGFTLADFDGVADDNPVFARIAAGRPVNANQQGVAIFGHVVTRDYFGVLGGPAAMGRTIAAADFATASRNVVVLSHEGWRNHFKADPSIVGKEVTLAGGRFVVIGVMPAGAVLPGDEQIGFWAPLPMAQAFEVPDPAHDAGRTLFVVGRRRADVTATQVRAWFDTWAHQQFPSESPLAPTRTRVDSLATRIPVTRGTVILFSLLTSAFGLVLLVACANVTNMLLARGLGRQRELGVRLSLGAGRGRIVRQLIIESLVLSVPAAALGLALTYLTARGVPRLITETIPTGAETASLFMAPFDPDIRVLALLIAAGFVAALLAGLSPALQLTRASLVDAMRGELGPNTRISRVRSAFVIVQIATCVLFLVAAIGLVAETRRMANAETGLDYQRVLDLRTSNDLRPTIAAELAARGDVEQVAAAWRPPLIAPMQFMRVTPLPGSTQQSAGFLAVSPEYFATMGVQVGRGRVFTSIEAQQDAAVVIVSDATARAFWPGQDPIGQQVEIVPAVSSAQAQPRQSRVTVIGVAEDVVNGTLLDGIARTTLYFPTTVASPNVTRLLVRTRGDSAVAVRAIAGAIEAAHPTASFQLAPMTQRAALQVWAFNAFSTIAVVPAVIGVLLSFAGTYGVVAFLMTQRTREFGIRMALGATAGHIMQSVVGGTVRIAIAAAVIGLAATIGLIRGASAVFGIVPVINPWIYGAGVVVVVAASAFAALLPAMRAIRLNPSMALRSE
jgi:putative ABC transport system permease protein